MKSSTRLDSALFQLTPTRTRCDLVISANGKTEKIASGLLNPFLAHLKTAQQQMAKGGYSIILEPDPGSSDVSWFTKGTVERFVRFVSTPEILERVYTLESEILQIEEAIAIQGNNETAPSAVEESPAKPTESIEDSRTFPDTGDEKAIVLYKPGVHPPDSNGSTAQEGNSKVQLLKVLETRKTVLQKEQGMAFARAVAAGFDVDNISPLMSFSEGFGASRLMDACKRFKELWKKKHETGQWVEIEAAEAMSNRSDFSAMNASGIMLSSVAKSWPESHAEVASESNGKSSSLTSTDEKPASERQPPGPQEYFQGQFPHQMFPPWPIHSPPGTVPVFQAYPMQGMPYYQSYPGAGPFYQPPYTAVDDPRLNTGQRMGQKRHSMDSSNGNIESETWEMDAHRTRSSDDGELEKEPRKRGSRSGKKQSGVVVIRNVNYIASKGQNNSDDESGSASGSETDEEDEAGGSGMKHKNSTRSSKRKETTVRSSANEEEMAFGKEADGEHWQAFQNFLLRDAHEDKHAGDKSLFSMESKAHSKRRQNKAGEDPLLYGGQDIGESQNGGAMDMQKMSGNMTRMRRSSANEPMISRRDGSTGAMDGQGDVMSSEMNGRRVGYKRSTNDDFLIDRDSGFTDSLDPLAVNGFERGTNSVDRRSSQNMDDASYIVPLRSTSRQVGNDNRNAIDMDSELLSARQKGENWFNGNQVNYEPEELSMMPQRGAEKEAIGYDPALDYEMQAHTANGALNKKNKEAATDVKQGSKKPGKGLKSKLLADDKKKNVGPIRRTKPSKLSPMDEARARAEKMRTYKADLQKMKKEMEETEMKRLEALKIERQRRIASRGTTIPAQQARKLVPTRTSPSSLKGTKFSDAEPGSSSPLQRYPVRTSSMGSSDSQKTSKTSRLNAGSQSAGNRLTRSASSLPAPKKESNAVASETKATMARIRRLSEPKMSSSHPISSLKARSAEPASKSKVSDGSAGKKISAIVNHDKSKAATLPELKTKPSTKGPDVTQSKSTKKVMQKGNPIMSSTTSEGAEAKMRNEKISDHSEGDENTIVEKTVVMLECGKPSVPAAQASEENLRREEKQTEDVKVSENTILVTDYTAIPAPVSKITRDTVSVEPTKHRMKEQTTSYEASISDVKKELPKVSGIGAAEKLYQAPYARVSSFEDPCTKNSEYGKAAPTNLEPVATSSVTVQAQMFDPRNLKLEKIPETVEKPQGKESSKGFRRLLKFGRKGNSSGAGESDNVSTNGSEADDAGTSTAASNEVHTLKNLISQDETSSAGATPQKASRHFSLLSPFRSKTSEKKRTTS